MNPAFSIIIPAHNEENYIAKTLHSIKSQSNQDFEVIVVSNGSSDETEGIVWKKISEKLMRGKLKQIILSQPSVSLARNCGAKEAKGELLLFLDADTTLEPETLQKIKSQFSERVAVATTKVKPDLEKKKFKFAMNFKNFYHTMGLYQGCSGALICRKVDFDKVGGYDPNLKVKEHRKLIIQLKRECGDFKCMDAYVTTSMRRFNQWGLAKATWFWIKQWAKNYTGNLEESEYEKVR